MSERFKTCSAVMLMLSRINENGEEETNLIDDRIQAIQNYKNNIHYSEFGWKKNGGKSEII